MRSHQSKKKSPNSHFPSDKLPCSAVHRWKDIIVMKPGQDTYPKARKILRGEPTMGRKRLAVQLGVKRLTSRRLPGSLDHVAVWKHSDSRPRSNLQCCLKNPMPNEAAAQMERDPAEEARRAGYAVAGDAGRYSRHPPACERGGHHALDSTGRHSRRRVRLDGQLPVFSKRHGACGGGGSRRGQPATGHRCAERRPLFRRSGQLPVALSVL